jgi:hypothetical protein
LRALLHRFRIQKKIIYDSIWTKFVIYAIFCSLQKSSYRVLIYIVFEVYTIRLLQYLVNVFFFLMGKRS